MRDFVIAKIKEALDFGFNSVAITLPVNEIDPYIISKLYGLYHIGQITLWDKVGIIYLEQIKGVDYEKI